MTDLSPIHSAAAHLSDAGLSQHARLLTLATAQGTDLPESLVVERFTAREAVNELFQFDIDALSVSATLDLRALIGEEITLRLLQPDGSRRAWHGFCTVAKWCGSDGGFSRYRLRLEPALSFLRHRRDSFLFQDKHVADIAAELFGDYPQVNFRLDLTDTLPVRTICTQYRETDLDFLLRILASEGLNFRFAHEQEGETKQAEAQAKHQLIIFDSKASIPDLSGGSSLRFHGVRATDSDDAINRFSARRQAQPNAVALSSWDPALLHATAAERTSSLAAGDLPQLPIHDGSLTRHFADAQAAERHAEITLHALELGNKSFSGAGSVRRMAAGHRFTLTQHDAYPEGENRFTVLAVEHQGANNLDTQATSLSQANSALQRGTYRNTFVCIRDSVAIAPPASSARRPPSASGAQPALVVGLPDAPLTTERDHQVKVQFPWQRGMRPNGGGLHETGTDADTTGNAPGDHTSGTWVRVAEALAGANWGTSFIPRIDGEVLVDFMEGDMDQPVIVAQLYNGADLPPYAAGVESGINHAGVISGLHSRALKGDGYNQWVIDDTQGQLRMRLATSSAASQLNLGYLVAQQPTSAQRGQFRGTGFELRTDAWAVVRAEEGMLLSTTARPGTGASVASTQMDAAEAIGLFKGAQDLTQRISDAARHQQALLSTDANTAQQAFITATDPEQDGKYTAAVNGQEPRKATPGNRELDVPVEKFAAPLMLLDTPASTNMASPASSLLFAGGHLHWSTQGDVQMTAAHTSAGVSGKASTLFTHDNGIQVYAANGPVSLAAHTDRLDMMADQAITVQSVNGRIEVKAAKKIAIIAGQSSVTLEDGNITFTCPGQFSAKGSQRLFSGAGAKAAEITALPQATLNAEPLSVEINHFWPDLEPMVGTPFLAVFADGSTQRGTLDAQGHARLDAVPPGAVQVFFGEDSRPPKLDAITLIPDDPDGLADDLRRLGMDPESTDLQSLLQRASGRIL